MGELHHEYRLPIILVDDGNFGFRTNQFGFNYRGISNETVVVEGSTNLTDWTALTTNTFGAGPCCFRDPGSTNCPGRFYRAKLQ